MNQLTGNFAQWREIQADSPQGVVAQINHVSHLNGPSADLKVWVQPLQNGHRFRALYRPDAPLQVPPESISPWVVVTFKDYHELLSYLKSQGGKGIDPRVCARWETGKPRYYLFYRNVQPHHQAHKVPGEWEWHEFTSRAKVLDYLNFGKAYKRGFRDVQITSFQKEAKQVYCLLARPVTIDVAEDHWTMSLHYHLDSLMDHFVKPEGLPSPINDRKCMLQGKGDYAPIVVFEPSTFLIVTRDYFCNDPSMLKHWLRYLEWKQDQGFEVRLASADWIDNHVEASYIEQKIQKLVRRYHSEVACRYAMLIGDSAEGEPNQDGIGLHSPWDLPPGGYVKQDVDGKQSLLANSFYFGDFDDKKGIYFSKDSETYNRDFRVSVGVVPVRTTFVLGQYLDKATQVSSTRNITFVFNSDFYDKNYVKQEHEWLLKEAKGNININFLEPFVKPSQPPTGPGDKGPVKPLTSLFTEYDDVNTALFDTPGLIYVSTHTTPKSFPLGNIGISLREDKIYISGNDYEKGEIVYKEEEAFFQHLNPLYIAGQCYFGYYHTGWSFAEAFLMAPAGPVCIAWGTPADIPNTSKTFDEDITLTGFWRNLLAGESIGESMRKNANDSLADHLVLFGDPSIRIIEQPPLEMTLQKPLRGGLIDRLP